MKYYGFHYVKSNRKGDEMLSPKDRKAFRDIEAEDPKMFKGKPLDYWREMETKERAEILEQWEMYILSEKLVADFADHFGYPEKLTGDDMDNNGALMLMAAVIKQQSDIITNFQMLKQNNYREYSNIRNDGRKVNREVVSQLKNEYDRAVRWMLSDYAAFFLLNISGDSIVRQCEKAAWKALVEHYRDCPKCKMNITIKNITRMINRLDKPYEYLTGALKLDEEGLRKLLTSNTTGARLKLFLALQRKEDFENESRV